MSTVSRVNLYHVPAKQWNRWTPHSREVFNNVYSTMQANQSMFLHPKATPHSRAHWKTVAWNAAWTAANASEGYRSIEAGERVDPPRRQSSQDVIRRISIEHAPALARLANR